MILLRIRQKKKKKEKKVKRDTLFNGLMLFYVNKLS